LSFRPRSGEQVPPLTAQVARASNPGGTTAIWVRDRLDGLWCDEDFADWYPRDERSGLSPAQLATAHAPQTSTQPATEPNGRLIRSQGRERVCEASVRSAERNLMPTDMNEIFDEIANNRPLADLYNDAVVAGYREDPSVPENSGGAVTAWMQGPVGSNAGVTREQALRVYTAGVEQGRMQASRREPPFLVRSMEFEFGRVAEHVQGPSRSGTANNPSVPSRTQGPQFARTPDGTWHAHGRTNQSSGRGSSR
jgi:hypothetical protein